MRWIVVAMSIPCSWCPLVGAPMLGAGSVKLICDLQSLTLLLLHTQP